MRTLFNMLDPGLYPGSLCLWMHLKCVTHAKVQEDLDVKYAGVKNGEVTFEVGKICLKFAEPKQSALMRTELVDFAWMSMKIPAHASPVHGDVRSRCFPAMGSANPKFI